MKNSILSKLSILFTAFWLVSCVSASDGAKVLPSLQELDEWLIDELTNTRARTGVQGYEGISGRLMELLLLVSTEMAERHGERCSDNPLTDHIFYYQEEDDVLRVQTAPRDVPDDRPPPPPPPEGFKHIYTSDLFDFPENAYELDGCEIQFVIDKKTKQIISTYIMR